MNATDAIAGKPRWKITARHIEEMDWRADTREWLALTDAVFYLKWKYGIPVSRMSLTRWCKFGLPKTDPWGNPVLDERGRPMRSYLRCTRMVRRIMVTKDDLDTYLKEAW